MEDGGETDKQKNKKIRNKRNRYHKIPLKTKLIFFQKVIHEHGNLIQIANKLGIKYSTAKTLTRNYKACPQEDNPTLIANICDHYDLRERTKGQCSYRSIMPSDASNPSQNQPPRGTVPKIQIIYSSLKIQQQ